MPLKKPGLIVILLTFAITGSAQHVLQPRIPPLAVSEWTNADLEALGNIAHGEETLRVFKTCLRNLELCRSWMPFTRYVLSQENSVPFREKELVILRTTWLCKTAYVWAHHVPAVKQVLTDNDIQRIPKGPDARGWTAFDAALLRATDELYREQHLSDHTWNILKERYNERQLMDLIFTVGQYTLVSMFVNSAGVQIEPGLTGFPK